MVDNWPFCNMKKLLAFFAVALCAATAQAQFSVSTDTNGVLTVSVNGRSTNIFATNMSRFMAAFTNDLTVLNWLRSSQPSTNSFITNSPSVHATNITVNGKFTATNAVIDGLTATNFSAPGSGNNSTRIGVNSAATNESSVAVGNSSLAGGENSIALGVSSKALLDGDIALGVSSLARDGSSVAIGSGAEATNGSSAAIGSAAKAYYNGSTALGASAVTTAANQIRLGTAAGTVSAPGVFLANTYSNNTFVGTNQFNGEMVHLPRTYSTAISGYASAIQLGTNSYVRVTGASAAVTNASFKGGYSGLRVLVEFSNPGLSMTLLHNSSIGAPAATEIINTGTGALVNSTNNPAWFELMHNGVSWNLLWIR